MSHFYTPDTNETDPNRNVEYGKMIIAAGSFVVAAVLIFPSQSYDLFWSVAELLSPSEY